MVAVDSSKAGGSMFSDVFATCVRVCFGPFSLFPF